MEYIHDQMAIIVPDKKPLTRLQKGIFSAVALALALTPALVLATGVKAAPAAGPELRIYGSSTTARIDYSVPSYAAEQPFIAVGSDGTAHWIYPNPNMICGGGLEPVCEGSIPIGKADQEIDLSGENTTVSMSRNWEVESDGQTAAKRWVAFAPAVAK